MARCGWYFHLGYGLRNFTRFKSKYSRQEGPKDCQVPGEATVKERLSGRKHLPSPRLSGKKVKAPQAQAGKIGFLSV
jgi:hypothetical protein